MRVVRSTLRANQGSSLFTMAPPQLQTVTLRFALDAAIRFNEQVIHREYAVISCGRPERPRRSTTRELAIIRLDQTNAGACHGAEPRGSVHSRSARQTTFDDSDAFTGWPLTAAQYAGSCSPELQARIPARKRVQLQGA
jgi:hypothetical protein